ncbi:MAG: hypothetical protein ACLP0Q_16290, partial [Rhodoblastus sp.]
MIMLRSIAILFASLMPVLASAQISPETILGPPVGIPPNCIGWGNKCAPTTTQWDALFEHKVDVDNTTFHVSNTTALQALASISAPSVYRDGFASPGDGGAAMYISSSLPCSLDSGAGDKGSEVSASDGGCWNIDISATGGSYRLEQFGAPIDNGTNDSSAAWAAAVAAMQKNRVPIVIDANFGFTSQPAPLDLNRGAG